jgi:hypothetical protein
MSTSLPDRLLSTLLNVRRRLQSLLDVCRTHEHPSWMSDDDWGELHRFCGPYRSDIEELETSIVSVSTLVESLRSESQSSDSASPLPDYPLCKNGWTLERIERLEDDDEQDLNLEILALLRLQTLAACIHKLDEQRCAMRRLSFHVSSPTLDSFP